MNIEKAEKIARQVKVQWEKTNFLEKELKKINQINFFVGRRKIIMELQENHVAFTKATAGKDYSSRSHFPHLVAIKREMGHYAIYSTDLLEKTSENYEVSDFGRALAMAIKQMLPSDQNTLEGKELQIVAAKALTQWNKTNILEAKLKECSRLRFIVNKEKVLCRIEEDKLKLLTSGRSDTKIERVWGGDSFLVRQDNRDNYRKYFKKNLSEAILFAVETVVAPRCSKRELNSSFDSVAWNKPRPHDDAPLFTHPQKWQDNTNKVFLYEYNYGEKSVFCFLPAKRNEGILFELDETYDYDYESNASSGFSSAVLKDVNVKEVYRFLIPQALDKIYNLEYKTLKQPTPCCRSRKAVVVQCERDKPTYWGDTSVYDASFLHEMKGFDRRLKEEMKWLLDKWNFIDSNKLIAKDLTLEGIIAVPGGKAEKMNFAAVFVQENKELERETFIKPISSKGAIAEASGNKRSIDSKGVSLLERAVVEKSVSKIVQERMKINLEKVRQACSSLVYSEKVMNLLGE
jgi:hypothetical protein